MSGQAGGRGYLIQAVIAVLDALNDREWTECVLEPNVGEDKVDLLFRSADGDRISQIKSSENAIGLAQVRSWAESLEAAYPGAKHYELRLIGPVTSGVTAKTRLGNVEIPVPETLNIRSLLEQCAHRLDHYLRTLNYGATRPKARELLANALATRLGTSSANGESISREALALLLGAWVAELFSPDGADDIPVPHQIPGAPGDFVGRHDELMVLTQAVEHDGIRVILIRGMTGVGKSALAARVASEWEPHFSDGQVYLQIRDADFGQRPTARLLTEAIQAFRPTYPTSDNVARCCADYRTLLKGRRILLLVESVDEAGQVEQLVPPTVGSILIVTTQTRFDLPGALTIDLDVLPAEDGTRLVQSIAPRVSDVASILAQICGYLPLAIRIAGGTLNARPDVSPDDFIMRLGGVKERAKLVRAALDVSLSHASDETRLFLLAASVFSIDFDAAGVAAVWGKSQEMTDTHIATVIGRHLLCWDDNRQRYSLHNLVHSYITELADARQFGLFAIRHACYYAELCSHLDDLYRTGGESAFLALGLFDTESPNIASGFYFCAEYAGIETSAAETCTTFVRGLTHIMDLRLPLLVRAQILLSGLEAAEKLGVTGLTVLHTGNLGRVYRELGDLDGSIKCQEWVLKMATAEGHRKDQAYAHHHIGLALLDKREMLAAVDQLEKALEISRDPTLEMRFLEASTLGNLGVAYLKMDRPAKAKDYRNCLPQSCGVRQ